MRQGDPLSPYLFIIVLEILPISIRKNDNIQGIIVNGTEIKLELFADDLTSFVRNDKSLSVFLEAVKKFGNVSGLIINFDKTVLGNPIIAPIQDRSTVNVEIKEAVKILGVYFTYNRPLRQKLNFTEIIECVHDGHVGGPKQYNDFPLGNKFYFYANIFYCFSPPTWLPCTHSIDAIKTKLQLWKWRNLTIIGRIQIIKTFVIPMLRGHFT